MRKNKFEIYIFDLFKEKIAFFFCFETCVFAFEKLSKSFLF